ncbi:MAG: hypothetical protein KBA61_09870 [Spirochaetes bacterium]|nr:hypothetical protein [Spirochaetota bacterium]
MNTQRQGGTRLKLTLFTYGLTGFFAGILAFLITMALNVPWLLFTDPGPGDRIILGIGDFLNISPFICMALAFGSFGVLIVSLFMEPRQLAMRSRAAGLLPRIIVMFFLGAILFVLIVLGTVSVLFFLLYSGSGNIIQLGIGILAALFGLGMIKGLVTLALAVTREELRPPWLENFLSKLRPDEDHQLPERVDRPR